MKTTWPPYVKVENGWKAVIRKTGFPTISKTFSLKRDAEDWALRDRRASNVGHITNEFLTLMSGFNSKPKDVLVIAATNFPEELDPAIVGDA